MVVKSKAKPKQNSKTNEKAKATLKPKVAVKAKTAGKLTSKPKAKVTILKKEIAKSGIKASSESGPKAKPKANVATAMENAVAKTNAATPVVKRTLIPLVDRHKPAKRSTRVSQFAFMKAPGLEHAFEVGDTVEVFCDHEKSRERIRGWIKGIVVQVDNKMVAVQFRSNVYLTDGWMVPDRILWYPLTSEHIRTLPGKKPAVKKDFIPDY